MTSITLKLKDQYQSEIKDNVFSIERFSLKNISSDVASSLQSLSKEGISESEALSKLSGFEDTAQFLYYIEQFKTFCLINEDLVEDGKTFATYVPFKRLSDSKIQFNETDDIHISRFTYIQWKNNTCVLKTPLAFGEMHLIHADTNEIIRRLTKKIKINELYSNCSLSKESIDLFLTYLFKMKVIGVQENETLKQWEFHDLLFHAANRECYRHDSPIGGTYRFKDQIKPLPVIKSPMSSEIIPLYKPDMEKLKKEDKTFTEVLEKRASIREHGNTITDKQLGEFLYRSARVKEMIKNDLQSLSKRCYPGGGAIYELEIYPLVHECCGLSSGLYHYNPLDHHLEKIKSPNDQTELLLKNSCHATGKTTNPQILFMIAPRFQRFTWKYQTMAYSLMHKNSGVLIQTMYLVATAMDLAPSAIGCGNSDLFAETVGTDYYKESSIAEFILGAK